MTGRENERLAALEEAVSSIKVDVTDIKKDVKALLAFEASASSLGSLGKYFLPALAVAISAAAFLKG